MGSLSYIPRNATLLLFEGARTRLMALKSADFKPLDEPQPVDKTSAPDLSAHADGVLWADECNVLAEGEKAAFVSQLVMLGYSPQEFRVTVRLISSKAPADVRLRYSVTVVQVGSRMSFRGKRYVGGHGVEWVREFCRDAPTSFAPILDSDRHKAAWLNAIEPWG
jgi:hypothetical protein